MAKPKPSEAKVIAEDKPAVWKSSTQVSLTLASTQLMCRSRMVIWLEMTGDVRGCLHRATQASWEAPHQVPPGRSPQEQAPQNLCDGAGCAWRSQDVLSSKDCHPLDLKSFPCCHLISRVSFPSAQVCLAAQHSSLIGSAPSLRAARIKADPLPGPGRREEHLKWKHPYSCCSSRGDPMRVPRTCENSHTSAEHRPLGAEALLHLAQRGLPQALTCSQP